MVRYNHEYAPEEKIRLAHLGCGGHSFRNILPCLQYLPAELVAVCDRDKDRAQAFARQFGAQAAFTDYGEMLATCAPEAVSIVTGYGPEGLTHAPLAIQGLEAGCHVFVEKPPAASVAEVMAIQRAEQQSGKFLFVGFKKAFFPAVAKAREIAHSPEFGPIGSIYARYPQRLPLSPQQRQDPKQMRGFLDHIVHPGSILRFIGGEMESLRFSADPSGGTASTIRFRSGALGLLHLVGGMSGTSPLERLEVVGAGANVVVDNGVRLIYYRKGGRGEGGYGRAASFIGDELTAPLFWEPEFSLGQLYNKNLFMLGYVQELAYFLGCVATNTRPQTANSDWALSLLRLYEAYQGIEDEVIPLVG